MSGSEVTAHNYMSALTDYIEQLPDFPLRGQAFSLHHPGMRIIGFRKTLLIAFLVTNDSVVILSVLSTRHQVDTRRSTHASPRIVPAPTLTHTYSRVRNAGPTPKTLPLPHPTVA